MCTNIEIFAGCQHTEAIQEAIRQLSNQLGWNLGNISEIKTQGLCSYRFCIDVFNWEETAPELTALAIKVSYLFLIWLTLHFFYQLIPGK